MIQKWHGHKRRDDMDTEESAKWNRINSAGLGEHPQGTEGEEIADRKSSMDPVGCLQGGSTAETLEECGHRKRKCHCILPGFLFLSWDRRPQKKPEGHGWPHRPPSTWSLAANRVWGCVYAASFLFLKASGAIPHPGRNGSSLCFEVFTLSESSYCCFPTSAICSSKVLLVSGSKEDVSDISRLQKWIGRSAHSHSFRSHGSSTHFPEQPTD